jgi:hypothetical protein
MSDSEYRGSVMKGVGRALAYMLAACVLGGFWATILPSVAAGFIGIGFLGIGAAQLLWVIPAVAYFRKRNEPETAKGIIIVAGIVALLNASCWGIFASML